jgi:hypothetical protein
MNNNHEQTAHEASELDVPLRRCVAAVLATPIPPESLSRVVERVSALQVERPQPPAQRRWLPYSLATSVAAALLIAAGIWALTPSSSWAEVVKAMQTRAWIHGVFKMRQGDMECWLSPEHKIHAVRFGNGGVVFDDVKNMTRTQYRVAPDNVSESVVIRERLSPESVAGSHHFMQMFESMVRGEEPGANGWPNAKQVSRERRNITDNGRTWTEFDFGLRFGMQELITHVVIRVDSKTNLPASMQFKDPNGEIGTELVLDYPESNAWPRDVYDLGVPRDAKVDDRMPSKQLDELIARVREGQEKFGPYAAIVAVSLGSDSKPWQAFRYELVWRKGAKFRVDFAYVLPPHRIAAPPANVQMFDWLRNELKSAKIVPSRVCDGDVVWNAKVVREVADPDELAPEVEWEQLRTVNVGGEFDSYAGSVSTSTLPDAMAYGMLPVPTQSRTVSLVSKPAEGPADCLLAELRLTQETRGAYHLSKYWYDPEHAYCMRHSELSDVRPMREDGCQLDVHEIEEFAKTPSGVYYPTRVRRTCDDKSDKTTYYWYYVDFNAELPDSLFEPKARSKD